jgi:hypothetical protein
VLTLFSWLWWGVMMIIWFVKCFDNGFCFVGNLVVSVYRAEVIWWGGFWLRGWIGLGDLGFLFVWVCWVMGWGLVGWCCTR